MRIIITLCLMFFLLSCSNKQKTTNDFDPYVWADNDTDTKESVFADNEVNVGTEVSIPFEVKSGVKYIPVKINGGPTFDMIFDTGCSGTLISIKEAQYLVQAGLLSPNDYRGDAYSSIADGSIVENMVFNLKEIIIGGKIQCSDVTATVSKNIQAPMLLGNEVLDRMPFLTIDNENQVVKFKIR